LIEPHKVNSAQLASEELKDGVTWGLRQLGVRDLWETTQGEEINVAVMDTGVHSAHLALAGKVRDFVMIDPLARRIKVDPIFDSAQQAWHPRLRDHRRRDNARWHRYRRGPACEPVRRQRDKPWLGEPGHAA
jgi:hypothetical protein